jgi:hypothetical protein
VAGIFDLHVVMALQHGWDVVRADVDVFKAMFADESISDALLTEWHTRLVEDDLQIRASWTLGPPTKPIVGIALDETPNDEQPLGYVADIDDTDGTITHGMIVDQTVAIRSWASPPEISRALRVMLRALMMDYVDWFAKVGYADVLYMGGGDLRPEDALIPEDLGTWVQLQRWRAVGEARVPDSDGAPTHKDILVASDDVTVGGYQGGVSPTYEE